MANLFYQSISPQLSTLLSHNSLFDWSVSVGKSGCGKYSMLLLVFELAQPRADIVRTENYEFSHSNST